MRRTVNLNPLSAKEQRRFIVYVAVSIFLVVTLWFSSIHSALSSDVSLMQETVGTSWEYVKKSVGRFQTTTQNYSQSLSDDFELAKKSYQEHTIPE